MRQRLLVSLALVLSTMVGAGQVFAAKQPVCGPLPPSGSTTVLDYQAMHRPDEPHGVLGIRNEHWTWVVAILKGRSGEHLQAVTLHADAAAQIRVPSGHYELEIQAGLSYCNLETGFRDGVRISVLGGVSVKPNDRLHVVLKSQDPSGVLENPRAIKIKYERPSPPQIIEQAGPNWLDLQVGSRGVHMARGFLNGRPVEFVVDTGATWPLFISPALARQTGVSTSCKSRPTLNTANGRVVGCEVVVNDLVFGPFRLKNVRAVIVPGMNEVALIGMGALQEFSIVSVGDRMRILPKGAPASGPDVIEPQGINLPVAVMVPWPDPHPPSGFDFRGLAQDGTRILGKIKEWLFEVLSMFSPEIRPLVAALLVTAPVVVVGGIRNALLRRRARQRRPVAMWPPNPRDRADKVYEMPSESSLRRKLRAMAKGDDGLVERLIEWERKHYPNGSEEELIARAIDRWMRDRGDFYYNPKEFRRHR